MTGGLGRRLGIYREERPGWTLLAAATLALELAEAFAGNAADALYLGRVGAHGLGLQLALSSALLVVTLGAWGALADRVERARLLARGAALAAGVLLVLRAGLALAPAAAPHALLVVTKQLAAVMDLGFWVVVADRFDARQARRLVPTLVAVGGVGLVAGSLLTRPLSAAIGVENLFVAAAVAEAAAAFAVWRLARGVTAESRTRRVADVVAVARPAGRGGPGWRDGWTAVRASPLATRLAWIVAVAGAVGPLLYSALGAAASAHFHDEARLAGFYGGLRAATHAATLLVQVVLAPLLWRRFGVGEALVLAPLAVAVAAAALAARADLTVAALAQAAARLVDAAVEAPAEKLAQNLLAPGRRGRVGGFLDGVAKRAGAVVGGAAVALAASAALGAMTFVVAVVWLALALALARRYGALAVDELSARPLAAAEEAFVPDAATRRVLAADLAGADEARREHAIDLLARGRADDAAAELVRAGAAVATRDPAARRRLVLPLEATGARTPLAGPADAALEQLFAAAASGSVDDERERAALVRAAGRLLGAARFEAARATFERLCGADASPAVRLAATCALLGRLGEPDGVELAIDAVLGVSPEGRRAAAEALVRGRVARAPVDPAAERVAVEELRALALADAARRPRLCGWLVAAAHGGGIDRRVLALDALAQLAPSVRADAALAADLRALAEEAGEGDDALAAPATRLLAALADPSCAGLLAARLADAGADAAVREAAAAGLAALGAPALPALLSVARFGRRGARDAALEVLRELSATPAALDDVALGELAELHRTRAHAAALARHAAPGPGGELLRRRLAEREREIARTLLLVVEVRLGERRVGAAAERLFAASSPRARARALEALDALLPRSLGRQLVPALEEVSDEEGLARAASALGGLPDADAAARAELSGGDALARALVISALGAGGRAAHAGAIRAAAQAAPAELDARRLLRRIADSDEDAWEMPGKVDTMDALRRVPLFAALSARQLADLAALVVWQDLAEGAPLALGEADAEALFVVAAGRVRVEWSDGRRDDVSSGGAFGEAALLGAASGPERVVAAGRATLGRLPRASLEALVDDAPRLALALARAALGANAAGAPPAPASGGAGGSSP